MLKLEMPLHTWSSFLGCAAGAKYASCKLGTVFGSPYTQHHSILGSGLGPRSFGNSHICGERQCLSLWTLDFGHFLQLSVFTTPWLATVFDAPAVGLPQGAAFLGPF